MNTVILKIVVAIAVGGQVVRASTADRLSLVEVSNAEARDLLNRGKAVLPTDEELAEAGYEFPASGTVDGPLHPDIEAHNAERAAAAAEAAAAEAEAAQAAAEAEAAEVAAAAEAAQAAADAEAAAAAAAAAEAASKTGKGNKGGKA